jgi:diacylglycerol kinase family enzyme
MASRVGSLGGLFTGLIAGDTRRPGSYTEPQNHPIDGPYLHITLLRPPGLISLLLWFLAGWLGVRRFNPFLVEAKAREFVCRPLDNRTVYCEADGEWLGQIPMRVSVASEALTVLLPRR